MNHPQFNVELWDLNSCYCEATLSGMENDLNFEHHGTAKQTLVKSELINSIGHHMIWTLGNMEVSVDTNDLQLRNFKKFPVNKVFAIGKISSYDKGDLIPVKSLAGAYDYITRTTENRGICAQTAYLGDTGLCDAGTFSLGLMSKNFFYREREWYAGQFMRIVKCLYEIDDYIGIYLENELNTLSKALNSKLVRDVDDTFYDFEIDLPTDDSGEIDFAGISDFVKNIQKRYFKALVKTLEK